jgi:predicted DNA-binding mobile mystery protein A
LRLTPRRSRLLRVSAQLERWRTLDATGEISLVRPHTGWIRHLRDVLNMTGSQLGARMGVRQPTIARLEQNERAGAITLRTLGRAAEALGCDVVYAFVPRVPLTDLVERQAHWAASLAVRDARIEESEIEEYARQLLVRQPAWMWGNSDQPELLRSGEPES